MKHSCHEILSSVKVEQLDHDTYLREQVENIEGQRIEILADHVWVDHVGQEKYHKNRRQDEHETGDAGLAFHHFGRQGRCFRGSRRCAWLAGLDTFYTQLQPDRRVAEPMATREKNTPDDFVTL